MTPQKFASVRYKSRPAALAPFRDDTNLVALRYDQTIAAEPPIPIVPPPRSSLRNRSSSTATRPFSTISGTRTIVVPRRPPPPMQQHPALRTTTPPRTNIDDEKRDSGLATTIYSRSETFFEGSDDEETAYAYEKIDCVPEFKGITDARVRDDTRHRAVSPLLNPESKRSSSVTETNKSDRSSLPLPSASFSETTTIAPSSPATPTEPDFIDKAASLFARRFSLRSAAPSMKSNIRASHKSQPQPLVESDSTPATPTEQEAASQEAKPKPLGNDGPTPQNGQIRQTSDKESPHLDDSPKLPTTTAAPDGDDFYEFLNQMTFSKRGSIMLGGRRPRKHHSRPNMTENESGVDEDKQVGDQPRRESRAFPLAPSLMAKDQVDGVVQSQESIKEQPQSSEDDKTVDKAPDANKHVIHDPSLDVPTPTPTPITPAAAAEAPEVASATKPPAPPNLPTSPVESLSVRVLSVDTERESAKVRSLYESGEGLRWEDSGRLSALGETEEVPSDVDENDVSTRQQNQKPSEHHGDPSPNTRVSGSITSSASPRDSSHRRAVPHERAGGLEDWENVDVEDVDRYGFINARRPQSRSSVPADFEKPVRSSPSKRRNKLVRKGPPVSMGYLGAFGGPTRRQSAVSLNTHNSEVSKMSTASRLTTRSAFRVAANRLPHNKDRRWMDEAGDMLEPQPGMEGFGDDQAAGKLAAVYKQKETSRTEKWRRMAKVIKGDKDGAGMVFEFDTKNPKLIERTWKGIPDRWRTAAWYSFLAASARNSKKPMATDEELIAKYHLHQAQPSPDDVQIDLDVPRTINQHIMFRRRYRGGQRLLFRVLHALSLYFPETGYVQGMASLAATFLNYYDEEKCFIMLVRLWELRGLKRLYQPGFAELIDALRDFEKYWLADRDVAKKLQELSIDATAYGTRWYLTLFNLSIPFAAQLRVWDVFMLLGGSPPDPPANSSEKDSLQPVSSRGLEILHATSAAIIQALREQLLDSEFENAMKSLTSWIPIKDEEMLMKVVHAEYKQHLRKARRA